MTSFACETAVRNSDSGLDSGLDIRVVVRQRQASLLDFPRWRIADRCCCYVTDVGCLHNSNRAASWLSFLLTLVFFSWRLRQYGGKLLGAYTGLVTRRITTCQEAKAHRDFAEEATVQISARRDQRGKLSLTKHRVISSVKMQKPCHAGPAEHWIC